MPEFKAPDNYKDPAKIETYKEEAKAKWLDRCALSPLTGKILVIGWLVDDEFKYLDGLDDERTLLNHWSLASSNPAQKMIGFNNFAFDLPYCQKRAWKHGVTPMESWDFDPFRQSRHIDLKVILEGRRPDAMISLDTAAKFLGVGQKNGEGKDFAKLWATDRKSALSYLENDLRLCAGIAHKMGVTI